LERSDGMVGIRCRENDLWEVVLLLRGLENSLDKEVLLVIQWGLLLELLLELLDFIEDFISLAEGALIGSLLECPDLELLERSLVFLGVKTVLLIDLLAESIEGADFFDGLGVSRDCEDEEE
jgi:hypothetical protein